MISDKRTAVLIFEKTGVKCAVRTGNSEVREVESVANLHGAKVSRPNRDELTNRIGYLLEHVKDDEAVYAAWVVLNRAYNRQ